MDTHVTPETNAARLIAEAVASNMARASDHAAPPAVEELPPDTAAFTIKTPMGSFYVRVTAL